MDATKKWITKHGYRDDPARLAVLDYIVECLDKGFQLHYVLCWDWVVAPTPEIPMPVAICFHCSFTPQLVLNGLFPPECDRIRYHLPDNGNRNGTALGDEMCVVATLATLLHQRGLRLEEWTVSYLHGQVVAFWNRPLVPPAYARIRFFECVNEYGWDEVADYLAERQKDLQYWGTGRRPQGRPKDEEFEKWAAERFEVVRNVAQVAEEAAAAPQFTITRGAASKRIKRSRWYRRMAPPVESLKCEPASPPQPAVRSDPAPIADTIKKHIQVYGPHKAEEFAAALGIDAGTVEQVLKKNRDRFQYLLGDRYGLWE